MVTRIHSACKFCYYVHTNDRNLRPMFFSDHALKNNLWIVTRIHSACKLCYYVHTNDYPARMRRGKVIGLSVCLSVVVTTKIARSRHLGT